MKGTLIEIKNNLQGNSSRVEEAEIQINDLEHKGVKKKPIRTRRRKKNQKKKKDSKSSLWDNFERSNIHILGVPEGDYTAGILFDRDS